jgi:hypothetical protein
MAKPIKDTPTITGKDLEQFQKNMLESSQVKISETIRTRMQKNFLALKAIANTQ